MVTSGSSLRSGSQPLSFGQCHGGSTPGHRGNLSIYRIPRLQENSVNKMWKFYNTYIFIYKYVFVYICIYTEHIACNIIGRFWKRVVAPKYEL